MGPSQELRTSLLYSFLIFFFSTFGQVPQKLVSPEVMSPETKLRPPILLSQVAQNAQ